MGRFGAAAAGQLDALERKCDAMRAALSRVAAYLGEEVGADEEPEIVLHRVHAFVTSFGKACRDNERAAFLKRRAAEEEEKERVRREGGRGGSGTPSGGATPRKMMTPRAVAASPGALMTNIQMSLKRGLDVRALRAQMSDELAKQMAIRRNQLEGDDDD